MTQKEINQRAFLRSLIKGYFKMQKEFCESIPALKLICNQLTSRLVKVDQSAISTATKIGFRNIKLNERSKLCYHAHLVASGLYSYAVITKNKVLKSAVTYSYSDFYRAIESEMLARCKQILRTVKRTKGLDFVGINPSLIHDLSNQIEKYESLMFNKVEYKIKLKKSNRIISKQLAECMTIVETQLKPLMKMLYKLYPENVNLFYGFNKVHKQPGRKKKRNPRIKTTPKQKRIQVNTLQQKTPAQIIHRFAELANAE